MHDNQKFWYVTLRADSTVLLHYAYAVCIVVTSLTSCNSLGPSGSGTVGLGDTQAFIRHDTHWFFQTRVLKHACPSSCLDMPVWTCRAQLLESVELHAELWFRSNHLRAGLEASFSL